MILGARVRLGFGILGICVLANSAFARNYGAAGCGLGSIVFKPSGSQTSAATSNGIAGTQLFGITSGTSNCKGDMGVASLEQETFVSANYATLSKEMAQGQGATVAGLASVLGCEDSVQSDFAAFAQTNYSRVFSAPGMFAMLDQLKIEMAQDPILSKQCKYVSLN